MRPLIWTAIAALGACSPPPVAQESEQGSPPSPAATVEAVSNALPDRDESPSPRLGGDDARTLRLTDGGVLRLTISCVDGPGRLVVDAPSFTPIGSEDRFSFGIGNEPVTLVADPTRQKAGGGVTGEGPVPPNLAELFAAADQVSAHYGAQQIGSIAKPETARVDAFVAACSAMR